MIGDGDLIIELFNRLDEAYTLLAEAESDEPLYENVRKQWFDDRAVWIKDVELLMHTHLEGWTPYDGN